MKKIIFVVGPTASGKSKLALELAKKFGSIIVNCDSIQCYQHCQIGSAKPSAEDLKEAVHLLYDYVSPPQEQTVGEYTQKFWQSVSEIPDNVSLIVVGGTGFYFQAIEKGLWQAPAMDSLIEKKVLAQIESEGLFKVWEGLVTREPELRGKIQPQDQYRIVRAESLFLQTGLTRSQIEAQKNKAPTGQEFQIIKFGMNPDKGLLRKRIQKRIDEMFLQGFVDEVRELLKVGLGHWAPLRSVGYKEVAAWLNQGFDQHPDQSLETLKAEIEIATWQLAKKQKTWFKRDSEIFWLNGNENEIITELEMKKTFQTVQDFVGQST